MADDTDERGHFVPVDPEAVDSALTAAAIAAVAPMIQTGLIQSLLKKTIGV